ncbi:response regulator transcription factor [Streptomyces erythrochromogenes]|uniref:response regulator transcription factor n=1 Tax=Streptomyces erythrochromogenes TaxID=285574 RepID=UPI00367ED27D
MLRTALTRHRPCAGWTTGPGVGYGRTPPARHRPRQEDRPFLDDLQRTILRAMVEGETDERIARRIGLSRRTVVSHIRKVAERFGSNSRAQLGYLLAGSGLLAEAGGDARGPGAPPSREGPPPAP